MFLFWSGSDNSEAQHFIYFHFLFPSAGRSFMLEFLCWSSKVHLIWCFPNASVLFGHLLFGFRIPGEICVFADPEGRSVISLILDPDSDLLDAAGIMMDFFKQPRASVQIEATWSFWTFWVLFDRSGRFCLLLCLCIILTWNPIDYHCFHLLLVVHQRIYCFCISSLCL